MATLFLGIISIVELLTLQIVCPKTILLLSSMGKRSFILTYVIPLSLPISLFWPTLSLLHCFDLRYPYFIILTYVIPSSLFWPTLSLQLYYIDLRYPYFIIFTFFNPTSLFWPKMSVIWSLTGIPGGITHYNEISRSSINYLLFCFSLIMKPN